MGSLFFRSARDIGVHHKFLEKGVELEVEVRKSNLNLKSVTWHGRLEIDPFFENTTVLSIFSSIIRWLKWR